MPRARPWTILITLLLWGVLGMVSGVGTPGTTAPGLTGGQHSIGAADRRSASARHDPRGDSLRSPDQGPAITPPSALRLATPLGTTIAERAADVDAAPRHDSDHARARGPPVV